MTAPPSFAHRFARHDPPGAIKPLPAEVEAGEVHLVLEPGAPARLGARGSLAIPGSWSCAGAQGAARLEISAVGHGIVELSVRLDPPASRLGRWRTWGRLAEAADGCAGALRDALEGRSPEAVLPPAPAGSRGWAVAVVVALVVTLAGVGALLSGPGSTPITADAATHRFRAEQQRTAPTASAQPPSRTIETAGPTDPPRVPDEAAAPAAVAEGGGAEADPTPAPATGAPEPPADPTATPPEPSAPEQPAPASPAAAAAASGTGSAAPPPADRPEPGVYRYETNGWEELSVPGSRRTLPPETAQTVSLTDCGYRTVWEPIEERTDELAFCVGDGTHVLREAASAREFYGHRSEERFHCGAAEVTDGDWSVRCEGDGTRMTVRSRVGPERTIEVAGESVRAIPVSSESVLEGRTDGRRTSESWVEVGTGLLLRTSVAADLTTGGPFGSVRYREEHHRAILSRKPTR